MIIVLSNDQLTHNYTKKYLLQMLNITNGKNVKWCTIAPSRVVHSSFHGNVWRQR